MLYYRKMIIDYLMLPGIDWIMENDHIFYDKMYTLYKKNRLNQVLTKGTFTSELRTALKSMVRDKALDKGIIKNPKRSGHAPIYVDIFFLNASGQEEKHHDNRIQLLYPTGTSHIPEEQRNTQDHDDIEILWRAWYCTKDKNGNYTW